MIYFKKLFLTLIIILPAISFANDMEGSLYDPNTNTNNVGTDAPTSIPCPGGEEGIPGEETECNQPNTNVPGKNVPINDYIPLLALAAITIGGITFYRNQKQII